MTCSQISITDPAQGFTTTIRDLTTHQTGCMTASAAQRLHEHQHRNCAGTPYTFHAEYNTASSQQNRVPWAALEGGVLMEQEIGHSEVCSSLKNQDPFSESFPNGQSYSDDTPTTPAWADRKARRQTGEGPCSATTGFARTRRPRARMARWPVRPITRPAARCASTPTVTASRRGRGPS